MMSISGITRGGKIGAEPELISVEVRRLATSLEDVFKRAHNFTAFMRANPTGEFTQVDVDKYTNMFSVQVANLNEVMKLLIPLIDLENEVTTDAEFLAAHKGKEPAEYSKKFD